jgi:hypothetical protein
MAQQNHSPLCHAFAKRPVRELRETLDNLILLGQPHLRHTFNAIEEHHNARPPTPRSRQHHSAGL